MKRSTVDAAALERSNDKDWRAVATRALRERAAIAEAAAALLAESRGFYRRDENRGDTDAQAAVAAALEQAQP